MPNDYSWAALELNLARLVTPYRTTPGKVTMRAAAAWPRWPRLRNRPVDQGTVVSFGEPLSRTKATRPCAQSRWFSHERWLAPLLWSSIAVPEDSVALRSRP